jgi:hypothetical protein
MQGCMSFACWSASNGWKSVISRLIIIITDDEIHLADASVQLIETMDDMEALDLLRDCNKLLTEIYADIREAYYSAGYEITVDDGETRH